jgi:hypothetical protein
MADYIKYGIIVILAIVIGILSFLIFFNKKEKMEDLIPNKKEKMEDLIPNKNDNKVEAPQAPQVSEVSQPQAPQAPKFTPVPILKKPQKLKKIMSEEKMVNTEQQKKVSFKKDFDVIEKKQMPSSNIYDYTVFNKYDAKYNNVFDLTF